MKITMKNSLLIKKIITISILITLASTVVVNGKTIYTGNENKRFLSDNSQSNAFILTTDYFGSSFSVINMANPGSVEKDIADTNGDDEVRYYNGKVYVLNRFSHDLIEVFDATNNFNKILEFSTGTGSNPQDIAFISENKAYVSCYDKTDLLIVNPTTGEHLGSINLSSYADEDGFPEMHKMVEFKFFDFSRVYLNIQRLDRDNWYTPTDKSYILEIDGDRDEVIRAIQLTGLNPSTAPILDGIHIIVGESGSWFLYDGGIERINIFTNEAEGFFITEEELGGNIVDFDIYKKYTGLMGYFYYMIEKYLGFTLIPRVAYAVVSDNMFNTSLVSFDLSGKTPPEEIYTTAGYQLSDLAINDNGKLYLSDRTPGSQGIRIFNAKSGAQETSEPIEVGAYPPVHITFI